MSGKSISIEIIIDNIIDKDKIEFNKKSNTEQNNDRYKISKEINGLLKGRNNEDRKEILAILLEKVNEPSQSFFDSNGNIDIDKIKVLTNNSIKNAIEKGLILPNGETKNSNIRKENIIESIILTPIIINKMINNYENISIEEKQALWNEYANLSRNEQRSLEKASSNVWYTLAKNAVSRDEKKHFDNMGKIGEKLTELYDKAINGDKDACQVLFEAMKADKEFMETYNGDVTKYSEYMRTAYASHKGKQNAREQEVMKITQEISGEISSKDKNQIFELIKQEKKFFEGYKSKNPNRPIEYDDLIDEYRYFCREREITLEKALGLENKRKSNNNKSQENISEKVEDGVQNIQNTPVLEDMNFLSTSEPIDLSNEFSEEETKENLSKDEVTNALKIYKEYFQDFDEETIEAISEMTIDEIASNLKEDFDSMLEENQIDDKTKNLLYVLADNLTSSTKNILLDSKKREVFFEQMQDMLINETIKDSEISELFEKISVEILNGEIEQLKEDFEQQPIQETDAQSEFLERHENFEIDSTWEEMCRDAQAKGKTLTGKTLLELLEKYKEEVAISEEKVVRIPENRGEKIGNNDEIATETPITETVEIETEQNLAQAGSLEEKRNIDFSDGVLREDGLASGVEHFGTKGKNERFAVIEKDEKGEVTNVQVFKPIDFLKKSEVTFSEIEQEQQILTEIVKSQMNNRNIQAGEKGTQGDDENSEKEDLRE